MTDQTMQLKLNHAALRETLDVSEKLEATLLRLRYLNVTTEGPSLGPDFVDEGGLRRDDYPRVGCTIVVETSAKGWDAEVYAPGFLPGDNRGRVDQFGFPHLSIADLGKALDAFMAGEETRDIHRRIRRERKAQASSGSAVTL